MSRIQLQCRNCGSVNRNLNLKDTGGSFECEACGSVNRFLGWKDGCFPIIISDSGWEVFSRSHRKDYTDVCLDRMGKRRKRIFSY